MTAAEKLTTADVHAALRLRYTQPEWALLFEVGASTGWAGRYADAISMNMYPSRGLAVHGHEVKVSRSDWQRELKNPDKAERISRYCDFWWLVTLPGIVKEGELPHGWGLMELHGKSLRVVTKAAERETVPLDRGFVASLLRQTHKIDTATVNALVEAGLEQRTSLLDDRHRRELHRALEEKKLFDEQMVKLKAECGVDLRDCLAIERLAGWIKLARQLNLTSDHGSLRRALREVESAQGELQKAQGALTSALAEVGVEMGSR